MNIGLFNGIIFNGYYGGTLAIPVINSTLSLKLKVDDIKLRLGVKTENLKLNITGLKPKYNVI